MNKGTLYLCATPIGNLEDITLRVLRILREVDIIAAEDTRHTRKLLSHFNIRQKLTSYHEHNKKTKGTELISLLQEGQNIALVSDAGMPGISDPGSDLVVLAIDNNIDIVPLPGPSASLSALTVSGLPTEQFVFEGFLPHKKKEYQEKLKELAEERRTIVLYEAPHRLEKTLKDLLDVLGDRKAAVIRELTKKFEEINRAAISELLAHFSSNKPRGEITIVLAGKNIAEDKTAQSCQESGVSAAEEVLQLVKSGCDKKEAIKQTAKNRNMPKREVYQQVLLAEAAEKMK